MGFFSVRDKSTPKLEHVEPQTEAPKVEITMGDAQVDFSSDTPVVKFNLAQIEAYRKSRDQIAAYIADCTTDGRKRYKLGDPKFQAKLEVLRKELVQLEKICKVFE